LVTIASYEVLSHSWIVQNGPDSRGVYATPSANYGSLALTVITGVGFAEPTTERSSLVRTSSQIH
jgi:hypothetical protein